MIIAEAAAEAFLEVGVFVAVMLAIFGLVERATDGRAERWLARHRRLGPLAGAALGVIPGCGGAIVVMPLFARGAVSFGTVTAALVATMGESSFVLIAAEPARALQVHALLLVTGVVVGALVDRIGIDPGRPERPAPLRTSRHPSTVGAAAAEPDLLGRTVNVRSPSPELIAFWALITAGMLVAIPHVTLRIPESGWFGVDPVLAVGLPGALVMLVVAVYGRHDVACRRATSMPGVLRAAARETARVTTWVIAAFVALEIALLIPAIDPSVLPAAGAPGVLAAAVLGLIPSCGPQILLTSLYTQGALPVAALVANALSQDGDALLPLLAMDRRAAIVAAAITTVPGIGIGLVVLRVLPG